MFELSMIWAVLIAVAVFLYVALDGFDLGVGILFPFAKDARERDQMQAAIAPVWDGNETWLVLGGGGLLAAFPNAYAALMPALYAPIMMLDVSQPEARMLFIPPAGEENVTPAQETVVPRGPRGRVR